MAVTVVVNALANTNAATARCAVTAAGSVLVFTVIIPRMIWQSSKAKVKVASFVSLLGQRYLLQARISVAITKIVTTIVQTLCVSSIITLSVSAGTTWPLHNGQSGHASPEPVEATTPPITIRMYTEIAVASDRPRKGVSFKATGHRLLVGREAN
jgi:hypothetical protein